MSLDHLFAGWRMAYVSSVGAEAAYGPQDEEGTKQATKAALGNFAKEECVFCSILAAPVPDEEKLLVWKGESVVAMLNAFPYASGHVMVMPLRHVRELEELHENEAAELWASVHRAVAVLKVTYEPEGLNIGLNIGRAAGAGIPGHLHVHVVPRWLGDTNFMTAAASVRVLPEALADSWKRLHEGWS
ncbi:MAG: HIT family protein [Acidimicrobiales bacterium]